MSAKSESYALLSSPKLHTTPWAYFSCEQALSPTIMAHFQDLIATATEYKHHQSFYEAFLCDQSEQLDPSIRRQLIERMAQLTQLNLTDRLQVSIQRMDVGHGAAPHTDRPLLGFETARLILQFNPDWQPSYGGVFQTHPTQTGTTVSSEHPPHHNSAIGFVMTRDSFHSVTEVLHPRFTAVLYFWHIGNTEPLATAIRALTCDLNFASLPKSLSLIQDQAERSCPEEATYQGSVVAFLLQHWGYGDEVIHQGYADTAWPQKASTAALWRGEPQESVDESALAIILARWITNLYDVDFDVTQWARLRTSLTPHDPGRYARLASIWQLAFPS